MMHFINCYVTTGRRDGGENRRRRKIPTFILSMKVVLCLIGFEDFWGVEFYFILDTYCQYKRL